MATGQSENPRQPEAAPRSEQVIFCEEPFTVVHSRTESETVLLRPFSLVEIYRLHLGVGNPVCLATSRDEKWVKELNPTERERLSVRIRAMNPSLFGELDALASEAGADEEGKSYDFGDLVTLLISAGHALPVLLLYTPDQFMMFAKKALDQKRRERGAHFRMELDVVRMAVWGDKDGYKLILQRLDDLASLNPPTDETAKQFTQVEHARVTIR